MNITIEHEYRTVDKSQWRDGPWSLEPDKVQWHDEATGLPCLIVRGPSGALCGYVGVSEGHPYFETYYADPTTVPIAHRCEYAWCNSSPEHVLEVHGGVTFSGHCQTGDESPTICHIPRPGESENVWWIGFDAAHSGDTWPAWLDTMSWMSEFPHTYRDMAYVQAECAALAQQLKAMAT